jgi:sensitive to high expression protein 9
LAVPNVITERLVKARLDAVQQAKDNLEIARARESSSRKEVVGLLERKHAWSDADLERYMTLIRSEHLNDQGVQGAKDAVAVAEMALEESRTRLEKRERMQYHEEQIWSDTIRRNSTWVTFGLMGFNIFLLLATMVIIEPWRRRRLVKEIRRTLEENQSPAAVPSLPLISEQIEAVVEQEGIPSEALEEPTVKTSTTTTELPIALAVDDESRPKLESPATSVVSGEEIVAVYEPMAATPELVPSSDPWWIIEQSKFYVQNLFSEKFVSVRKIDMTTIALEGFAAGVAIMGLLIVILKPR